MINLEQQYFMWFIQINKDFMIDGLRHVISLTALANVYWSELMVTVIAVFNTNTAFCTLLTLLTLCG